MAALACDMLNYRIKLADCKTSKFSSLMNLKEQKKSFRQCNLSFHENCCVIWIFLLMCLTYVSSSSDLGSSLPSSTATAECISEPSSLFSFGSNIVNLPSGKEEKQSFICILANYKSVLKVIANK